MISVIIPSRNRCDLLQQAIASIYAQDFPGDQFEVLVIDNGSTDNTAEVIQRLMTEHTNLHYFHEPEPGLHYGRHRGMNEASGDILVFIDDDVEVFPAWLVSISEAFSDPEVALAGGNNVPMFLQPPPGWLDTIWLKARYLNGRALPALSLIELNYEITDINPHFIWGCNFAIRKSALVSAGGFHPDGMPSDRKFLRGDGETSVSEHLLKQEQKCLFHKGASVYHKVTPERMTYTYFHKRGYSQGISDSYTRLRNRGVPSFLVTETWLSLRFVSRFIKRLSLLSLKSICAFLKYETGYFAGYRAHQKQYRINSAIRDWVHKTDYY